MQASLSACLVGDIGLSRLVGLVHIGQGIKNHLVQQFIPADSDSGGLFVHIFQNIGVNAHGDHFFLRLPRNKFRHIVTILVLTIICRFGRMIYILYSMLKIEYLKRGEKEVNPYEIAYDMLLDLQQEIIPELETETGESDSRRVIALSAAYILQDYLAEKIASTGQTPQGEDGITWEQIKEALENL